MLVIVLTPLGANTANVQVILLLCAEKGSTKSHRVVTMQIMATAVVQIPITTMQEGASDVMKPHILQNIVITTTPGKIFS